MKNNRNHDLYYEKKMAALERLHRINEEFLSEINLWESYQGHLAKRDALIDELKQLGEDFGEDIVRSSTPEQATAMDNALKLILALDSDICSAIEKSRAETLESMKSTTLSRRITEYAYRDTSNQSGKMLDYKK